MRSLWYLKCWKDRQEHHITERRANESESLTISPLAVIFDVKFLKADENILAMVYRPDCRCPTWVDASTNTIGECKSMSTR